MHEAIGGRPSIQPPTLVASCPMSSHGQTAAEASTSAEEGPSQVSLSSEEEPVPSTSSQPPPKRPRRRSSVLAFLKKQAEKDEARDKALYEQNERLVHLIAELVKKNKTINV